MLVYYGYFGVLKAFKNLKNNCNFILSAFQIYCALQAKHSSLDFLIMVDDSTYFLVEQKFLDSLLIVVYDSIYFVWDFLRK